MAGRKARWKTAGYCKARPKGTDGFEGVWLRSASADKLAEQWPFGRHTNNNTRPHSAINLNTVSYV
jgi:hypothetical protein